MNGGVQVARTAAEAMEQMADEALRPRYLQHVILVDGRPATEAELEEMHQLQEEQRDFMAHYAEIRQRGEYWVQLMAALDRRAASIIT